MFTNRTTVDYNIGFYGHGNDDRARSTYEERNVGICQKNPHTFPPQIKLI